MNLPRILYAVFALVYTAGVVWPNTASYHATLGVRLTFLGLALLCVGLGVDHR